ncbi:MAG: hypothetical protein EB127_09650 [Alphaproteobacteria bacterium]|nr:hypothetical protein [Alphaproteobacteria bacterium]
MEENKWVEAPDKKLSRQILLDINRANNTLSEELVVSSSNEEAIKSLQSGKLGVMPYENILLIEGPASSGKTILASILANYRNGKIIQDASDISSDYNLYIVDNAEDIREQDLLHIFNSCVSYKLHLIIFARNLGNISLPDLSSRIKAIKSVRINEPDDEMTQMIIIKEFSKRSIFVSSDVIQFLSNRVERNFEDIILRISQIDEYCLKRKKNVSIRSISRALKDLETSVDIEATNTTHE